MMGLELGCKPSALAIELNSSKAIDPFPKLHRLVHNGGFTKFKALHCGLNMVNSTQIS